MPLGNFTSGDARSNQILREIRLQLDTGIDMDAVEKVNPKLKIILSNLASKDDVFSMDIDELREYFTDKVTKKVKMDVLERISALFDKIRTLKAALPQIGAGEGIPYACKILKPKEAISLKNLSKLNDEALTALYDRQGVVVETNKLNGMVLVMFSENDQVWVPRGGVLRTGSAKAPARVSGKAQRPVSKYISAAHLREKISTRSTSPRERERSRSRSQEKKLVRVKIPKRKEIEEAKQRTRARLQARMKKQNKKKRTRAKSQEQSAPQKGRGALFANDAAFPIRMPRRRAKSFSEVEKYQQTKDRITIGGLVKQTLHARQVIKDRNFKQRKGTRKPNGPYIEGGPGLAAGGGAGGVDVADIGESYAPYDKLNRLQKMDAAYQQQQQAENGAIPRKRPEVGNDGVPYEHPMYGNINDDHMYSILPPQQKKDETNQEAEDYATQIKQAFAIGKKSVESDEPEHGPYTSQILDRMKHGKNLENKEEGGEELPERVNFNDDNAAAQAGYHPDMPNQGWGGNNQSANGEMPWGPNQGWGAQVVGDDGAPVPSPPKNPENAEAEDDKAINYMEYHDRLFSQHLDGMGGATGGLQMGNDGRTLLERLSDKKNRVTLAQLKNRETELKDQLKKFDMHSKPSKPLPPNPRVKAKIKKEKVVDNRNLFERRRDAKAKHSLTIKKLRHTVDERRDLTGYPMTSGHIKTTRFEITRNFALIYEEVISTFGYEMYSTDVLRRMLGMQIHVHKMNPEKKTCLFEQEEVIYELPRSCLTLIK